MARLAKIVKNEQKKKLIDKYANLRRELKKTMLDENATDEQRWEAQEKLQKLPRNSSPIRYRNRCALTGRSRAYIRKFGLSRIKFRELALKGMLPGVTKSSW